MLAGIPALSAEGVKNKMITNQTCEIDLKITVGPLMKEYFPPGVFNGFIADVTVKNVGTACLKESEYPDFYLDVRVEGKDTGDVLIDNEYPVWYHHRIGMAKREILLPGENIKFTVKFYSHIGSDNVPPAGSTLKVILDPDNLIPESDDVGNNYWEQIAPNSKQRAVNLYTLDILNRIPFFQRVLKLLQN